MSTTMSIDKVESGKRGCKATVPAHVEADLMDEEARPLPWTRAMTAWWPCAGAVAVRRRGDVWNEAEIDIGATQHQVAVSTECAADPVPHFSPHRGSSTAGELAFDLPAENGPRASRMGQMRFVGV